MSTQPVVLTPSVQPADVREAEISAFEKWQREVDSHLQRMIGMDSADLPDYNYAGEFEMGCKPRTVARRAIRAAGGF